MQSKNGHMNIQIGDAFIEESKNCVNTVRGRINHCLDQLGDEDIWWAPDKGGNCIGVIVQHLLGNLRQWIISGVGGATDVRDRPREFRVGEKSPKAALQRQLNEILDAVIETYSSLPAAQLLEMRRIQGYDESVLGAIYGTMTHLELHAGQIVWITRMRRGGAYEEWCKPATKEQGA